MNKLIVSTLPALGLLALAACDDASNGTAQNVAQAPEVTFEVADANGDGRITSQEALTVPGLNFDRMDTDKNLSVTQQEFATATALSRPRG